MAAALASALPARAGHVAVVVRSESEHPAMGAHGLMVAGVGTTVSRRKALAALVRGRVHDSHLGEFHPEAPIISLSRRPAEITIYVELPLEGRSRNDDRYAVTIVGGEYRFPRILVSESTRIPGLLSIADIAPTVVALEQGREPRIGTRVSADPFVELGNLEARLNRAEAVQTPTTVALALMMAAAFVLALLTRSRLFARVALLVAPGAIASSLLVATLDPLRVRVITGVFVTLTVFVALGAAALFRSDAVLGRALVVFLGGYAVFIAVAPEVNAFAPAGPQPWSGGRFYGVTNLVETLLLAPALAAGALLAPALLLPVALLTLITVGGSETGADGGGILVVTAGFIALALRLGDGRLTSRRVALAAAGVVAVGLAFVGIDAASGGSSHVVDAVGSGTDLFDELGRRLRLSFELATESPASVLALVGGLATLAFFATRTPRYPTVDALLIALAVSLVANDAPTRVAGFGTLACATLWAFERFQPGRRAE